MTIMDFFQNFFAANRVFVIATCLVIITSYVCAYFWGVKAANSVQKYDDHTTRMNKNFYPYGNWALWLGVICTSAVGTQSFHQLEMESNPLTALILIFGPAVVTLALNRIIAEVGYRVKSNKLESSRSSYLNGS